MGCRKLQLAERFVFVGANDLDRLTTIESPAGKYKYRYDKRGRVKSLTTDITDTTDKKDDGHRVGVFNSAETADTSVYPTASSSVKPEGLQRSGRIRTIRTIRGSKVLYSYDKAGRLTAKTLVVNGKKTVIAAYKYDKLNRRVAARVLDTAWKYKYDKRNQLIGALGEELTTKNTKDTKNGNLSVSAKRNRKNIRSIRSIRGRKIFSYGFDGIGNRLSYATALTKETYDYNKLNQILNDPYKYDGFGNLISTPDARYKYSLNNRLIEVKQKDAKLTFSYDGNGRRIEKKAYNAKGELIRHTKFLYSGFKCVVEIDALTGKVEKFYQWQGEQLLGVVDAKSGKQLACLTDGNKNVVGLLDEKGAITAKYTYSPFGKLISAKGADAASCSFGFSSEYRDDESGLVYYNYRYLNPALGRWMTRDPIQEGGGFNAYAMVGNNLVGLFDDLGLRQWTETYPFVGSIAYGTWYTSYYVLTYDDEACSVSIAGPTYTGATIVPPNTAEEIGELFASDTVGEQDCCTEDNKKGKIKTKSYSFRIRKWLVIGYHVGIYVDNGTEYIHTYITCNCQ